MLTDNGIVENTTPTLEQLRSRYYHYRDLVRELQDKVNSLQKQQTDWQKWVQGIDALLASGFNHSSVPGGEFDSYRYFWEPGGTARYPLSREDLLNYISRGKAKLFQINIGLKQSQAKLETAKKDLKKAEQEYRTGVPVPPSKPNAGDSGVDTTTPEGIDRASGGDDTSPPSTDPETDTNNPVLKNVDAKKVKLKFNIPMVKSAYYGGDAKHFLSKNVLENRPNWVLTDNGRRMWQGEKGGKGVIQPNLTVAASQLSKTYKNSKAIVKGLNNKLYGFRFLYNPTSVSMNWGINQEVDYNTIGLGLDKGVPLTGNLAASSVSFELVLNRIEDLNVINSDGTLKVPGNPWPTVSVPDKEELKELYQRGTMYDLEHLFATLIPGAPKYRSNLNGILADRGYMSGYVVELHLGPKLRFSVQISDINVEHAMFNDRMVPMFSNVRIVATRLPDVAKGTVKGEGIQI